VNHRVGGAVEIFGTEGHFNGNTCGTSVTLGLGTTLYDVSNNIIAGGVEPVDSSGSTDNRFGVSVGVLGTNNQIAFGVTGGQPVYRTVSGDGTFASGVLTTVKGYRTGDGGTVTQATDKSTGVTLDKATGLITMNAAALAAATIVSFTVTNSTVAATDLIASAHESGGTLGAYTVNCRANGAGFITVTIRNNTAGSLSEAVAIRFAVIKSVNT
jgi:hypothetical protein